jgi:hypothetical protein
LVKTTPNPRATKKRSGELVGPLPPVGGGDVVVTGDVVDTGDDVESVKVDIVS